MRITDAFLHRWRRRPSLTGERGASAVEFAIIASLLLMILFGTITFGIIFNRYQGLQSAGREGARLGALQGTALEDIIARVKESVSIIQASSISSSSCPGAAGSEPSLNLEQGCVRVLRRPSPGGTAVLHTSTGQPGPCNSSQTGGDQKSVIVEVYFRLRIDIPLWASPQMTVSGSGEFRCE